MDRWTDGQMDRHGDFYMLHPKDCLYGYDNVTVNFLMKYFKVK